ncbi:hypothetical protein Nmel_013831 [Mimus melanotis]
MMIIECHSFLISTTPSQESSMEEFQDANPPEELLNHLKLSDQKCPEPGPRDAQHPQSFGSTPCPGQDPTEECFHDCHDSFEARGAVLDDEGNVQDDGSSSKKQTELDEEYLLELEKDMPEEEKQKRRKESTGLKEKGNEHFKKGDYGEAEESYTKALQICPACFQKDRAVLFSNRAAAKMKQASVAFILWNLFTGLSPPGPWSPSPEP